MEPITNPSTWTVLTRVSVRFGPGVYSYLEPSLADKHAVSTMSSPYRVMLACEVNLPPPRVQPSESSEIVESVSHHSYTLSCPDQIQTLSIHRMRTVRWSSCQERRRSFPSISYSTPNPRPPHPRDLMVACPCTLRVPTFVYPTTARLFINSTLSVIFFRNRYVVLDTTCQLQPSCHSVNYTKKVVIPMYTRQHPDWTTNRHEGCFPGYRENYGLRALSRHAFEQK